MDIFTDSNVAPDVGMALMDTLQVNALDMQTPEGYAKYTFVASYFGKFKDGIEVARMVTRNTPAKDKLSKVMEYIGLRKELDATRESLEQLPSSDTITGETDEHQALRTELSAKEHRLISELQLYER